MPLSVLVNGVSVVFFKIVTRDFLLVFSVCLVLCGLASGSISTSISGAICLSLVSFLCNFFIVSLPRIFSFKVTLNVDLVTVAAVTSVFLPPTGLCSDGVRVLVASIYDIKAHATVN